jgi:hypothetical protein
MTSVSSANENLYSIAYYLVTDIQHVPPVIRLFPHLGGIVITENKAIYDLITTKYQSLNIPIFFSTRKEAHKIIIQHKIRVVIYPSYHILFRAKAIQIFHGDCPIKIMLSL